MITVAIYDDLKLMDFEVYADRTTAQDFIDHWEKIGKQKNKEYRIETKER